MRLIGLAFILALDGIDTGEWCKYTDLCNTATK
jgi:hypothetical protein